MPPGLRRRVEDIGFELPARRVKAVAANPLDNLLNHANGSPPDREVVRATNRSYLFVNDNLER